MLGPLSCFSRARGRHYTGPLGEFVHGPIVQIRKFAGDLYALVAEKYAMARTRAHVAPNVSQLSCI